MAMFELRNFNLKTLFSLIVLLAGVALYISWGIQYGVWYDIGIYSLTIVLVLGGILGMLISLREVKDEA
jgi:hypothetical protein